MKAICNQEKYLFFEMQKRPTLDIALQQHSGQTIAHERMLLCLGKSPRHGDLKANNVFGEVQNRILSLDFFFFLYFCFLSKKWCQSLTSFAFPNLILILWGTLLLIGALNYRISLQ